MPLKLLGCLCAFGGQAVSQERVIDALRPDTDGDAADPAFRTTLHRLRKLPGHEDARVANLRVQFDPRRVWVDCISFDRVAHRLGTTDRAGLERAMDRYRGRFSTGESGAWATAYCERMHVHFVALAERVADLLEQAGDWRAAGDCWLRAIEVEPLAEGCYRRPMRATRDSAGGPTRSPSTSAAGARCWRRTGQFDSGDTGFVSGADGRALTFRAARSLRRRRPHPNAAASRVSPC